MYSHQLLRVQHDELLRSAENHRLIKQAAAEARKAKRSRRSNRPRRDRFGVFALRRPVSHA